jgi:hypothetical protein
MIYLEKFNENGKKIFWQAEFDGSSVKTQFGQKGGKIQIKTETYSEGKNLGRSNEKSSEYQCIFETVKKARGKVNNGYKILKGQHYFDEYLSSTTKEVHTDIPSPMLAHSIEGHWKKLDSLDTIIAQPKVDGCFSENTIISIRDKTTKELYNVRICDVEDNFKNHEILSFNEKLNKFEYCDILGFSKKGLDKKWITLEFEDSSIVNCTEDHLFLTKNRGWVEAKNLKETDIFIKIN